MLKPSFQHNKPVVITEFGYVTCEDGLGSEGFLSSFGLGGNIIDLKSQFLHQLPLIGKFVKPHLNSAPASSAETAAHSAKYYTHQHGG